MTEKLAHQIIRPYRLSRTYVFSVVVYTLVLMVTFRWDSSPDAGHALNSVGGWIDFGTIVLISVFSNLLNDLARGARSQSSLGPGPVALGPRP
jgi:hypothetical protein